MRTPVPQRTFADLEFRRQTVQLEPLLKTIAAFLDRQAALVNRVRRDLLRGLNRLTPETLQAINGATVDAAVMLGLEDGTKLRVDTTVAETDIHWPTDSTLLWDTVRVVT